MVDHSQQITIQIVMSLSLWIILYSKLFLVYDTNWKRLLWATSTHCYPHLHTCTWMHAYTRTQVCFWVIWLPLLSFLQRFWFRQRCFLWVEIQMLMHLKQLWQQSNAAQQTKQNKISKEKQKICSQTYFSTQFDLFLFKVDQWSHKICCCIKAKITHSVAFIYVWMRQKNVRIWLW